MTGTVWSRLRRGALWFLFAWILLIPKTLALRRQPHAWNKLRSIVGLVGAALAAVGASSDGRASFIVIVAGFVFVFFALVVLPERPRLSVDARSRELGALVVVKGGSYHASGAWIESLLFVGPERLSLLEESSLRPLLEIPVAEVTLLRAEPAETGWRLRIVSNKSVADLMFGGPFAEHFARVAESTVRSQMPNALPILQQTH